MAIETGGELGDLIVTLSLDDAEYRSQVAAALNESKATAQQMTAAFAGVRLAPATNMPQFTADMGKASAATIEHGRAVKSASSVNREAMQSVHALRGGLFLLTGETGFFIVEAGRAATHITRLTTAAGGLTGAVKGILSSVGLLTPALVTFAAVYQLVTHFIDKASEAANRNTEKLLAQTEAIGAYEKAARALALQRGDITPVESRVAELLEATPGLSPERARRIAGMEAETKRRADAEKAFNEKGKAETKARIAAEIAAEEDLQDRLDAWRQESEVADARERARELKAIMERKDALRSLAVEFGGRKPSDLMRADDPLRAFQLFREQAQARLKEAGKSGFGIGTVESSGFRFGPGAAGSVIGKQDPTTEAVKSLERTIVREFNEKFGARPGFDPVLGIGGL